MPKVRRQNLPPALLDHLIDRIRSRDIAAEELCLPSDSRLSAFQVLVMSTEAENTPCGDAGGWTALPVWETGARLGKARITSLAIQSLKPASAFRLNS